MSLGPGGEFDIIRDLVRRWGANAQGIGDDAASLTVPPGAQLVVSVDSSVERIHFRRDWLTPSEIGYRSAAAALSDLAAMAAEPLGMLIALNVPASWRGAIGQLGDGIGEAAALMRTPIIGGNITSAGELAITVTVLGFATHPLRRDGARPGDAVYVTGRLGGPLAALEAFMRGEPPTAADRDRFVRPVPRLREALWLGEHGAHACVDVSDGLAADLRHLAVASGVRISIDVERVPHVDRVSPLRALASGEEYEIGITGQPDIDVEAFSRLFGTELTRIGVVEPPAGDVGEVLLRQDGVFVDLPRGHDHFSS
jgi:thiamine-monophosphate kinase